MKHWRTVTRLLDKAGPNPGRKAAGQRKGRKMHTAGTGERSAKLFLMAMGNLAGR